MGVLDYFRPVKNRPPQEVRAFLSSTTPGDVNLVDVREPSEYEEGHLPGAQLIPVKELRDRLSELDPSKPTITYCAAGVRSRAAAAILMRSGFKEVWSMEGGIRAWSGLVAEQTPAAGMTFFSGTENPLEVISLCWLLEEGSRRFYDALSGTLKDGALAALFAEAAAAEQRHKEMLMGLYERLSGGKPPADAPYSTLGEKGRPEVLEGGMRLADALSWAKDKTADRVLEMSLALEAGACDVAINLSRRVTDPRSQEVFSRIAQEERIHADKMSAFFEERR